MNWQAGTMLHPGAQRSEHRIKAPACRETQQAGTVTTSWQSGRQHGARPQHHLGISLRLAPTQHNHCISSRQNNLKSLSEKRGEDHFYRRKPAGTNSGSDASATARPIWNSIVGLGTGL